ncbi:MAG: Zn-dependent exopeptidase M28 [Bacteroidaceae bacterium]|nr:Zn-dependent exopeptidase M28 [Bacteroidaceae bacterium]
MKKVLFLVLAVVSLNVASQDLSHYKRVVKELASRKYQGRGYAKGGANKAGRFLEKEYRRAGVDEVVRQPFTLDIQTFSGKMEMQAIGQLDNIQLDNLQSDNSTSNREIVKLSNWKTLRPGIDFSMREYSPGVKGEFPVYHVDTLHFDADKMFRDLERPEYKNCLVACEFWFTYKHREAFGRLQKAGECPNAGLIYTWPSPIKFFKAYGHRVVDKPIVWVTPEAIEGVQRVRLNVDAKFLKDYECFNVISKVEGTRHDSCFVLTAHYDHIGNLGAKVFYAGANDNASGSAALVTLAAYYAKHRPKFDIYFLAFSGEDANLRGSTYFVEHPTFPLEKIRYLINIDMIGDNNPVEYCEVSDAGMKAFPLFEHINAEKHYFKTLNRGDLAANSDHYVFATRGVPCIFLENEKGDAYQYYHTIFDNYRHAVFDSYEPTFQLVHDFIEKY